MRVLKAIGILWLFCSAVIVAALVIGIWEELMAPSKSVYGSAGASAEGQGRLKRNEEFYDIITFPSDPETGADSKNSQAWQDPAVQEGILQGVAGIDSLVTEDESNAADARSDSGQDANAASDDDVSSQER